MAELLRRMLPAGAPIPDDVQYSFALEYHGPPVAYDLPRAVPIDLHRIPTASVAPTASLPDRLSVPVVQPLPSPNPLKKSSKDAILATADVVVSPTSVITFDRRSLDACGGHGGHDSFGALAFSDGHGPSHESSPGICSSGTLGLSDGRDESRESSPAVDGSDPLGFPDGQVRLCELSGEVGSSGTLGFLSQNDQSHELSGEVRTSGIIDEIEQSHEFLGEAGSSGGLPFSNDCKGSEHFSNVMNQPDWVSSESVLSSPFLSSEASSQKVEDTGNAPHAHAKRTSLVTFRDAGTSDRVEPEFHDAGSEAAHEREDPNLTIRRGSCRRCFKGNRFTEKEACLVCNAKYCSSCVLRAMGSMPEGRKCVTCIGYPIDESKRERLGKCSRVLKRLLSTLEVQQAMRAERLCEANQLQAEDVYVNGKQLSQEEMVVLQACKNPPSKLKGGRYWYDKVSGLWGKEGQKPSMIISPHVNVGGSLEENASDGHTKVFINGREITKAELRMLKWAGVQCAGNPHFWVNADGSYQEEGQKNVKGNIWGKPVMKLICPVLSLPMPSKAGNHSGEELNNPVRPDYLEQRILQKFLLVGYHGSGTSTFFKQAKFLYQAVPFSEEERENIKVMIQSNVYSYLALLLEGRERFEEESLAEMQKRRMLDESTASGCADDCNEQNVYSIGPRLKVFSDWLLKVMVSGDLEAIFPAATREYAPVVEELWKDPAIQATYGRRSELKMLPSVASYFLERIVDISRMEYEPSDVDILHADGITSSNGLAYMDFLFPQSAYDSTVDDADQHDPLLRYELIRVHPTGLGENCKWLEMFDDVRIVIFCVSLVDYDQQCDDGNGLPQNKMVVSKKLFESLVVHPTFEHMDFLLILNKYDLLEKKIERVPLTVCEWFDDYNPVTSRHHINSNSNSNSNSNKDGVSPGNQAFHYIAVKFKKLFASLTRRKLYVSLTNALDCPSVDGALRYSREILKWEEDRAILRDSEFSLYSTEASSSH